MQLSLEKPGNDHQAKSLLRYDHVYRERHQISSLWGERVKLLWVLVAFSTLSSIS